jgi:hypothetical protein
MTRRWPRLLQRMMAEKGRSLRKARSLMRYRLLLSSEQAPIAAAAQEQEVH